MNRAIGLLFLGFLSFLGCGTSKSVAPAAGGNDAGVDTGSDAEPGPVEAGNDGSPNADGGLEVDVSAFADVPTLSISGNRFAPSLYLDHAKIVDSLTGSKSSFAEVAAGPDVARRYPLFRTSDGWELQRNDRSGRLVVTNVNYLPGAATSTAALDAVRADAVSRASRFGFPADEQGDALALYSMRQDAEGGAVGEPEADGIKVFIMRQINKVSVANHRAVFSYGMAGELRRTFIQWPALAESGHKLGARQGVLEIRRKIVAELRAKGITGTISLRWRLVPTLDGAGLATLTLKATARVPRAEREGSEPLDIDFDVQ